MTVLLIGAAPGRVREIQALVPGRQVRVVERAKRPDWIVVATDAERRAALASYGLPAHRVVRVPSLGTPGAIDTDAMRGGLARMAEVGSHRALTSSSGVALVTWLQSRIMPLIDGLLPESEATEAQRLAAEQAALEARLERHRLRAAVAALGQEGSAAGDPEVDRAAARARAKAARKAERLRAAEDGAQPDQRAAARAAEKVRRSAEEAERRAEQKEADRVARIAAAAATSKGADAGSGDASDESAQNAARDENVTERVRRFASRAVRWTAPSNV
jgi:hypothetical protein